MKITLVAVTSVDGKMTRGDEADISSWVSAEDQEFFAEIRKQSDVIVIGRRTYTAIKKNLKLTTKRLRVVLTREPNKYSQETVKGSLEFSNEEPEVLVERLQNKGYKNLLVLGGGEINGLFLARNLVDEIYLTVEPRIFGVGRSMAGEKELDMSLKLLDWKQLNNQGTILLHYQVLQ